MINQGYLHALSQLGTIYENGHGVEQNINKAIEFYIIN
jgi:TPR repeat protein